MSFVAAMNWPARRPGAALVLAAILALGSVLLVLRLRADASLQALTSSNDPAAQALDRVLNHFGAAQELLILVSLAENSPPDTEPLLQFAQRLEQAIVRDPTARSHDSVRCASGR